MRRKLFSRDVPYKSRAFENSIPRGTSNNQVPGNEKISKGIKGAYRNIALAVLITTAPLIAIPSVLLSLITNNLVLQYEQFLPELRLPNDIHKDPGSFLVNFSATQLTTLASWASSMATLMPGFLVSLAAYRVAVVLRNRSETANTNGLPTSYQLSLLMGSYSGGLTSLWNWFSYLLWKRRAKVIPVFHFAFVIFTLSTFLAYAIWAADTWLHVTTSTISFSKPWDTSTYVSDIAGGLRLDPECEGFYENFLSSSNNTRFCNNNHYSATVEPEFGYDILGNNASSTSEYDYQLSTIYYPTNGTEVSLIMHQIESSDFELDFVGSGFGFTSTCKPVSRSCGLTLNTDLSSPTLGAGTFNCSSMFAGILPSRNSAGSYSGLCYDFGSGCSGVFSNSSFLATTQPVSSFNYTGSINPIYFGIAVRVDDTTLQGTWYLDDPDVQLGDNFYDFILACQVEVDEITFSVLNGTITPLSTNLANNTVALLSTAWYETDQGRPAILQAINLAAVLGHNSTDLSSRFASSLSRIFAAFSATAFEAGFSEMYQLRENVLVTRMPKAPVITLAVLCYLLSLLGILLGIVALGTRPASARDVQARLSIMGLIASSFEESELNERKVDTIEELFAEKTVADSSVRVGMVKSEQGGWLFKTFKTE